jgi:hypothetical protein
MEKISLNIAKGTVILGHEVDHVIGRGCESEVYAVANIQTQRIHAFKIIPLTVELTADYVVNKAQAFSLFSRTGATPEFHFMDFIILAGPSRAGVICFEYIQGTQLSLLFTSPGMDLADRNNIFAKIVENLERIRACGYAVADFATGENILVKHETREPVFVDFFSGMPGAPNGYYDNEFDELESLAKSLFAGHHDTRAFQELAAEFTQLRRRHYGNNKPIPYATLKSRC